MEVIAEEGGLLEVDLTEEEAEKMLIDTEKLKGASLLLIELLI